MLVRQQVGGARFRSPWPLPLDGSADLPRHAFGAPLHEGHHEEVPPEAGEEAR